MSGVARLIALAFVFALVTGCGPLPDPRSIYAGDLQSPRFLGTRTCSPSQVELDFHERVEPVHTTYQLVPDTPIESVISTGCTVCIDLQQPMTPGAAYALYGTVCDGSGNSLQFITDLYGFNPEVPRLKISEFTTQGSGRHPDAVELVATTAGSLAGVAVYEGTDTRWEDGIVLPEVRVETGEFVVIHFKPEGIPDECDEVSDRSSSGGCDAHPEAWDFWVEDGDGLSGNNGVITVYASPGGEILDAVLYSNRTSQSDDRYGGFGSQRVHEYAEELVQAEAWVAADGQVRPEDAVNPDPSTATRSICRLPGVDTNGKNDWYVVPARGVSFGGSNTLEVYEP